jgi:hypothetical protein
MAEIVEFEHPAELEAMVAVELFDQPRRERWVGRWVLMGADEDYGGEPIWMNENGHAVTCAAYARSPDAAFEEIVPWLVRRGILPCIETILDRERGPVFRCVLYDVNSVASDAVMFDVYDDRTWKSAATAISVAAVTCVRRRKIPPSEK